VQDVNGMIHDWPCTTVHPAFACDLLEMDVRMAAVESGLSTVQSDVEALELRVESIEKGIAHFVVVQQQKTWSEANEYCADTYGTTLATIKDDDDAAELLSLWIASGSRLVWVGLNDQESFTNWEWASGWRCDGACSELSWWDGNEPHDNDEHCATLQVQDVNGMIHDWPCTTVHPAFACDLSEMDMTLQHLDRSPSTVLLPASEWSFVDWYHAHYQALILFLASTLVLFCGLNLCLMARSGDSKNKAYAAVKYMESDTEMDVEAKPIKM